MSGTIVDLPLYVCRRCKTRYQVDGHMYREPERCPKCGWVPGDTATQEGEKHVEE